MGQSSTPAWRVAEQVRCNLLERQHAQRHQQAELLRAPIQYVQRLDELWRRLSKALARQWYGAARRLHAQLHRIQQEAAAELAVLQRQFDQQRTPTLPSLRDLAAELDQIEDEFGGWRYDRRDQALSVTTEPIELEHVPLGRFEIRLMLSDLATPGRPHTYSIIALDPNPAAGSPQVTHPHVADERLCEGDACVPLRHALGDGRLCEFFMLVRSVLSHLQQRLALRGHGRVVR